MSDIVDDVMKSIEAFKLVSSPLLDPNTILVVNPQRMRDLFAFAPPPAPEPADVWGESLTSMAWRYTSLFTPFDRIGAMRYAVSAIVDEPESFELRCGPYEDVFEPWCVLKNLSTGRRLVVDWPLTPYYADRLVPARRPA